MQACLSRWTQQQHHGTNSAGVGVHAWHTQERGVSVWESLTPIYNLKIDDPHRKSPK